MESILLAHLRRYPQMEAGDAVKLLYQQEFGCGHLIRDPQAALRRLIDEAAAPGDAPFADEPLYEPIGGGLCRLNLRPAVGRLPLEDIHRLLLYTAERKKGTRDAFKKKLDDLLTLCEEDVLPFDPQALMIYLATYEARGYPAVSHTPAYRALYRPAYRVLLQKPLKDALAQYRE